MSMGSNVIPIGTAVAPSVFGSPRTEVERHKRDGRPRIILPDRSGAVFYTRCTTFAKAMDDTFALTNWKMRQVAIGLSARRDLVLGAAAHVDDRETLDRLCQEAMDAARSKAAATIGTALHKLTELHDAGQPLDVTDPEAAADVAAYADATKPLRMLAIEQFVVCDELRVGGTFDRIVEFQGKRYVADLKTGNVTHGMQSIAVQLAIYANSEHYDPATGDRAPLDVDRTSALVVHLPQGQAQYSLLWVNIAAGWEAAQLARQVREWRRRRDLSMPVASSA